MNGVKKRILVVDDSPANLTVMNGMLSSLYKVYPVDSGLTALKFLEKQRPDLILLDSEMPEMSGADLIRIVKANPKICDIPVIFLTANSDADSEVTAFKLGASDYIHKPVNSIIVHARIKMHLEFCEYKNMGIVI